jgi:uncharacterized protein (TIGR03067 family)
MPKAAQSKPKSDLDRLQGTWHVATLEVDGSAMPPGGSIVIDGSHFRTEDMGAAYEGDMSVDMTAKPKQFDIAFTKGPHKGERSLGIYELEGETWKLCMGFAGYSRPSAFATAPGCGHALETLRREPPAAAAESSMESSGDDAETEALGGEWAMVSVIQNGKPLEENFVKAGKRLANKGQMKVTVMGQTVMTARFTPDPTKSPCEMDYQLGGPKGARQLGIYKLDGDCLTTCFGVPGAPRPTAFSSDPGSNHTLSVWRRLP